jgi:phage baseplate assembly protein W
MNIAFPYQFDPRGRTATTDDEQHVRDLIEQVLFVAPGDRVMRPDFGSNVADLVFAPASTELDGAAQMLIQSALTRWLGEVIAVEAVTVEHGGPDGNVLSVTVQYRLPAGDESLTDTFVSPVAGP